MAYTFPLLNKFIADAKEADSEISTIAPRNPTVVEIDTSSYEDEFPDHNTNATTIEFLPDGLFHNNYAQQVEKALINGDHSDLVDGDQIQDLRFGHDKYNNAMFWYKGRMLDFYLEVDECDGIPPQLSIPHFPLTKADTQWVDVSYLRSELFANLRIESFSHINGDNHDVLISLPVTHITLANGEVYHFMFSRVAKLDVEASEEDKQRWIKECTQFLNWADAAAFIDADRVEPEDLHGISFLSKKQFDADTKDPSPFPHFFTLTHAVQMQNEYFAREFEDIVE